MKVLKSILPALIMVMSLGLKTYAQNPPAGDYKHNQFNRPKDTSGIIIEEKRNVVMNDNYKNQSNVQKTKRDRVVVKDKKKAKDQGNYKHQPPLKRE